MLDDIPGRDLDHFAEIGFDWIYKRQEAREAQTVITEFVPSCLFASC